MSQTVFILGAGASKECGAPLMAEFLDAAEEILKTPPKDLSPEDRNCFKIFFDAYNELQTVHDKAYLNRDNIEDVLSALEMASLVGKLGKFSKDEITLLRKAIRTVIVRTLEIRVRLPVRDEKVFPPEPYSEFCNLVKMGGASIITFNYDLALDYSLYCHDLFACYNLGENEGHSSTPTRNLVKLFKLHGSLNWATCEKCNKVYPWHLQQYFQKYPWNWLYFKDPSIKTAKLVVTDKLSIFHNCGDGSQVIPTIVPPVWNKTEYRDTLGNVWAGAARELSEAENIIIMGYSLPESDQFFRYLFAIGSLGTTRIKNFWVLNPDRRVEDRFLKLLGDSTRRRFRFFQDPFSQAIKRAAFTPKQ